jgi:hypothetical protein
MRPRMRSAIVFCMSFSGILFLNGWRRMGTEGPF